MSLWAVKLTYVTFYHKKYFLDNSWEKESGG